MEIRLSDIPTYLHTGLFYNNLVRKDDGKVEEWDEQDCREFYDENIFVPLDCFKQDKFINCAYDLIHLLKSLRFWIVDVLPVELIAYALDPATQDIFVSVVKEFEQDMPSLKVLKRIARVPQHDINESFVCALDQRAPSEIIHYLSEKLSQLKEVNLRVTICVARHGILSLLKFVCEYNSSWNEKICAAAARNGHIDCLKYLHEIVKCPWDAHTCAAAARNGHLNCLEYAHMNGCPWNFVTVEEASKNGHIECLRFAHTHGCGWETFGEFISEMTAYGGHLDCLEYLHMHSCPWNETTCEAAAKNGHLHCLEYAHKHGCAWDKSTCRGAAYFGHYDCMQYAQDAGCPY
eukprot:CAMPEP_0174963900 /NCGR_PEP_ID=MMETSP0004_2-20121128/5581_1 /TAXON_ID=420556 /ORGANISM="Ochromonas sp., Strain CCMP1393" /LENGTH=347 /DNA_ID=CAMNT_0016212565 /DNA_START=41 /DNA_END=1084 /DNA_ORIENTATION=+